MFFNRLFRIFFGHNLYRIIYIYIFDLGHLNYSFISNKTYFVGLFFIFDFQ
jgi:hypothetical protein